jgi:hypothetical protein
MKQQTAAPQKSETNLGEAISAEMDHREERARDAARCRHFTRLTGKGSGAGQSYVKGWLDGYDARIDDEINAVKCAFGVGSDAQ